MSGEWKEVGNLVVALPEDDPDVFSLYLQAIYVRVPSTLSIPHAKMFPRRTVMSIPQ